MSGRIWGVFFFLSFGLGWIILKYNLIGKLSLSLTLYDLPIVCVDACYVLQVDVDKEWPLASRERDSVAMCCLSLVS